MAGPSCSLEAKDHAPKRVAVQFADSISYIPTDEGWLYLAAVKDLATMESFFGALNSCIGGTEHQRKRGST